ncbi:acyltransferase family protein [Cellulomonas sp. HZM]|uniref:acyltransferase family protein n=1 Tax=Cellulomonas sp. HZM TaxID=1454010 RepID=UPI00068DABB5|nr:acyltransferase family protein [Cellulomonas sp. HZM]
MTTIPAELAPAVRAVPRRSGARRDIQVLRAVAVAVVVAYHLWPHGLTGGYVGVDVFFVISGFLITSHLLRRPPTSPRELGAFWARRVRRLLPAATLVLAATTVASVLLLPSGLLMSAAHEALASTFYVENWSLARQATDYLAADGAATPVQHFWSLGVEEQFYLGWPVLVGVLVLLGSRVRRGRWVVGAGIASVVVVGLTYGVHVTTNDAPRAYFVTTTRVWELALGGLVAVVGTRLVPRGVWRSVVAWAGLVAVAFAVVRFSAATPFPGWAALVPTLGAAAVVWADADDERASPTVVLGGRAVVGLGDVSYSVYLWHWPLVVLVPFLIGDPLTWSTRLGVAGASVLLAVATKRWVEDRFRTDRRVTSSLPRTFAVGALCMALSAALATGAHAWGQRELDREEATSAAVRASAPDCFGAQAAREQRCTTSRTLYLSPTVAAQDKPDVYADGCWNNTPFTSRRVCTYGSDAPSRRIALVGNSHAGHWLPAMQDQLDREGWQLSTYLVSECYTVDVPVDVTIPRAITGCAGWNSWVVDTVVGERPDLVVMSERTYRPLVGVDDEDKVATARAAYARVLERFTDAGIPVLVLRDTPAPSESAPDCVARERGGWASCTTPAEDAIEPDPLADAAHADRSGLVDVLDVNDLLCDATRCHDVVGGVIVYFDRGHLTSTFARTLRPEVEAAVAARIGGGAAHQGAARSASSSG